MFTGHLFGGSGRLHKKETAALGAFFDLISKLTLAQVDGHSSEGLLVLELDKGYLVAQLAKHLLDVVSIDLRGLLESHLGQGVVLRCEQVLETLLLVGDTLVLRQDFLLAGMPLGAAASHQDLLVLLVNNLIAKYGRTGRRRGSFALYHEPKTTRFEAAKLSLDLDSIYLVQSLVEPLALHTTSPLSSHDLDGHLRFASFNRCVTLRANRLLGLLRLNCLNLRLFFGRGFHIKLHDSASDHRLTLDDWFINGSLLFLLNNLFDRLMELFLANLSDFFRLFNILNDHFRLLNHGRHFRND